VSSLVVGCFHEPSHLRVTFRRAPRELGVGRLSLHQKLAIFGQEDNKISDLTQIIAVLQFGHQLQLVAKFL
jgi:hypothetical protein